VSPLLAYDTASTLVAAKALFVRARRRNLLIQIRQRHDERDLPWPRTDRDDQQIPDADPEGDAGDQFDDATQPLTEGEAEADDGSDRREERITMIDDVNGDQPGESRPPALPERWPGRRIASASIGARVARKGVILSRA
jgi:hypothetical protein